MLDVYDMGPFYLSDLYHQASIELDFLEDLKDGTTFKIPNENLYLYISDGGCSWFTFPMNHSKPSGVSFEKVLETVSDKMKVKLLCHLDIFRNEDEYDSYIKPYTFAKLAGFKDCT